MAEKRQTQVDQVFKKTMDMPEGIGQDEKKAAGSTAVKKKTVRGRKKKPKDLGMMTALGQPRTKSKVAIVGFAPSTMADVTHIWNDPDLEVWGLNQLYMAFPGMVERADRWFQIHHRHSYDQTVGRDMTHHQWLQKQTRFLIYMQKKEPDVPASVEFPVDYFLSKYRRYFTNSISWEIVTAIDEGFDTIYIFGVDMAQDSEHQFERPSVEYFIGLAEGAGANVIIPEKSDLLKSMYLYPYEDSSVFRIKIDNRKKELTDRINNTAMQEQSLHDTRLMLIGARDNMGYIYQSWVECLKETGQGRT